MNENTNDDLRSLRQRLRKLRKMQEQKKGTSLRTVRYHRNRPKIRSGNSVAITITSKDYGTATEEQVQKSERKKKDQRLKSKKKSSRRRDLDEVSHKRRSVSSRHRHPEIGSKRSTKQHVKGHGSGECRSSLRRSTITKNETEEINVRSKRVKFQSVAADKRRKTTKATQRGQTVDESEEHSLKPSKRRSDRTNLTTESSEKTSGKDSSKKKKVRFADDLKEDSVRSSLRRRRKKVVPQKKVRKKRTNHISVDFYEVPPFCSNGRWSTEERSVERKGSLIDDDESGYRGDASLSTIDTYWGERYFELQSEYTAEEAIEMLRDEKEIMREMETEKRELRRGVEEANELRDLLRKNLAQRNTSLDGLNRIKNYPYGTDDGTASQSTRDDTTVSSLASTIMSSIFSRRSITDDDDSYRKSITSGKSKSVVKRWLPDLQKEVGTDKEREQLKTRRKLTEAKKQRDRLSKKLAKRTKANGRLLEKLERMEGVSYDDESSRAESKSTWDCHSGSTMGTSNCSYVNTVFHPRVVGEGSLGSF